MFSFLAMENGLGLKEYEPKQAVGSKWDVMAGQKPQNIKRMNFWTLDFIGNVRNVRFQSTIDRLQTSSISISSGVD
jgi:hypothetical protein